MKKRSLGVGALAGGALTATMTAIMFLADQVADLPFVPFELFDWVTRVLPGAVVTFGIDLMIDSMRFFNISVADSAKTAEQIIAILQLVVIGAVVGAVFFLIMKVRDMRSDLISGLVVGALFGLPLVGITIAIEQSTVHPVVIILWLLVLFLAWGLALALSYVRIYPAEPELAAAPAEAASERREVRAVTPISRRQFLIRMGGAAATITVASSGVGVALQRRSSRQLEKELEASMAHQSEGTPRLPFPNLEDPVVPAPGTRPEYTPLKDHYKVFIRVEPTVIDGSTWKLPITGLVDNPLMLTLDDISNDYESMSHFVTLSCISGRIPSTLISTTQWTGVSLQKVLADAKVRDGARSIFITSGDGFYETVPLDEIAADERIMLTYAWDGNRLPVTHGFPLRIWRPDRYGMKQPRWITGIEVTDEIKDGYWIERGWDQVARVKTTSVIDNVAVDAAYESGGQQLVPMGGIAYSGARGISKVEISVDDGPWNEAKLRAPLSDTTWVVWRYDWPFESGDFIFRVRAQEGDGTPQIETEAGNRPSGATGLHRLRETTSI